MDRYHNSKRGQTQKRELIERRANEIYKVMLEKPIYVRKTISAGR